MHDRKNTGLLEISGFDFLVVLEQTPYMRRRIQEQQEKTRADNRVQFAVEQHLIRLAIRRNLVDRVAVRHLDLHARPRHPGEPFDLFQVDPILVLKRSAHPDRRRLLKLRQPDSFANQIAWLTHTASGIDENIREAKRKGGNNRKRSRRLSDDPRNE